MKIIQASFFWKNDKPGGLGFTFSNPAFSSSELEEMFNGTELKQYLAESDRYLGTISLYIDQLTALGQAKADGYDVSITQAILASYNIIWLVERGFIPNNEFNGYQFVKTS